MKIQPKKPKCANNHCHTTVWQNNNLCRRHWIQRLEAIERKRRLAV